MSCPNCKGWFCSTCNAPGGRLYIPEEASEIDDDVMDDFERAFLEALTKPVNPDGLEINCMGCRKLLYTVPWEKVNFTYPWIWCGDCADQIGCSHEG